MKATIIFISLIITYLSFGQGNPNPIDQIKNHIKNNNLGKAKEVAEIWIAHPKLAIESELWKLRGEIYYKIDTSENESSLDTAAFKKSLDSYCKALTLIFRNSNSYHLEIVTNVQDRPCFYKLITDKQAKYNSNGKNILNDIIFGAFPKFIDDKRLLSTEYQSYKKLIDEILKISLSPEYRNKNLSTKKREKPISN